MREFKVAGNKVNDLEILVEMQWPQLERLYLEWFYGNSLGDSISLLAKLESS